MPNKLSTEKVSQFLSRRKKRKDVTATTQSVDDDGKTSIEDGGTVVDDGPTPRSKSTTSKTKPKKSVLADMKRNLSKDKISRRRSKGKGKKDVTATQTTEDGSKGTVEDTVVDDCQTQTQTAISKTPVCRSPNRRRKVETTNDEKSKLKARRDREKKTTGKEAKDTKDSKDLKGSKEKEEKAANAENEKDKEKEKGKEKEREKTPSEKEKNVKQPRKQNTLCPTIFETVANAQPAVVHERAAVMKWTGEGPPPAVATPPSDLPTPTAILPVNTMISPVMGSVPDEPKPKAIPVVIQKTDGNAPPPPVVPADFYGGVAPSPKIK